MWPSLHGQLGRRCSTRRLGRPYLWLRCWLRCSLHLLRQRIACKLLSRLLLLGMDRGQLRADGKCCLLPPRRDHPACGTHPHLIKWWEL